jgi:adenine-specific DNA-methyltransferase
MNLSSSFDEKSFESFIRDFFPDFVADKRAVPKQGEIFPNVTYLGESEKLRTSVLVVTTTLGINSRISLTKASFKILKNFGIYRALIVYLNPDQTIWRLSLLTAQPVFQDGKIIQSYSNPERHSYVLGSDVGVASARKFLLNMGGVTDFEDLKYRFSIEAINKEFYNDISKYFYDLIGRYDESGAQIQKPLLALPGKSSHRENQEYAIRLFGRIVFCWFLKEKKSAEGIQLLPSEVFDNAIENGTDILHSVLEPLFFHCLNSPIEERLDKYKKNNYEKVPYLNGGLFHPNEGSGGDYFSNGKSSDVAIPDDWFHKLLETLRTYNFTLDENLDFDVELSIDPEMLGRIFENLLAEINPESGESARRTTGSFYTPRRIVSHMTDISLKRYLLEQTSVEESKIDALITIDALDDALHPLNAKEKIQISDALYNLKTLDPACGSGAFPIGMLQKLVFMLEQIDSELELGKTKFPKNYFNGKTHLAQNHNYLRKLILIRDVLHGVDIQPVAVEISKLRCFLTLIVEQEVLDDKENRGLEPLPNLDFQFLCANTLIKLDEDKQFSIWDDSQLEEQLEDIRQDYYSTNSKKKRDSLKSKYAALVNQELSLFGESKRTTQLKTFQPFTVNSQATFFDSKSMFGISEFDIVIGNPPYVKTEHFSEEVRNSLYENYFEEKLGKKKPWVDDLYVHFIFRAFELVGDKGIVCFITNDSFIGLDSKVRVREKLLQENLIELIGCPKETFGATIYTAIFLASRSRIKDEKYIGAKFTFPGFELVERNSIKKSYVAQLPKERFVLQEDELITKLLGKKSLGDFLRVIDTGIHSGNVREKIFSLTQTPTVNKRMIQGRQILRWAVYWDNPNAKFKYCNPDYVPEDKPGIGRGGKKSSLKEYWGFAGDMNNHFLPERLLLRQTGDSLHAAYQNEKEDGQLYTDNTLFTVVLKGEGSLKYFLGLLNSRVLNYVYHFLSSEEGKTLAQVKTGLVEQLPAVFDKKREKEVVSLVDSLISAKRKNPEADVSEVENKLDEIVCEIFELSEDDKRVVLSH